MTHENEWDRFLLVCLDFGAASRYAAEHDWWLHSWRWICGDNENVRVVDQWGPSSRGREQ